MKPILVGVDGSDAANAALEWASREATYRGTGLRLLHAAPWPMIDVPVDPRQLVDGEAEMRLLAAAEERARRVAPSLEITSVTTTESPAASLKHHAEDAELVVVGNRGHGGFVGLLVGSVALQVAGHAPCPVVLVPPGVRGGTVGEIVVGVGGRATQEPLRAAFEEARLRDTRLHVVHGWWSPPVYAPGAPVPPPVLDTGTDAERRAIEAQMNLIVGEWRDKYPTVPVTIEVINEPPRDVLLAAAQAADLVVVGTHDSGGRHLLALGSVAGSVVHHAQCPVLIAR